MIHSHTCQKPNLGSAEIRLITVGHELNVGEVM